MDNLHVIDTSMLVKDIFPKDEQSSENIAGAKGLLSGFNYMWNIVGGIIHGADNFASLSLWSAGTYNAGDQVIYLLDGAVYECTATSTTTTPNTVTDWKKIAKSFIGGEEWSLFGGGKLQLEYALNRRFFTSFLNPPSTSDIYLANNVLTANCFIAGGPDNSSWVYSDHSSESVKDSYSWTGITQFTIFIPNATYTALGTYPDDVVSQFVDQIIPAGITYSIVNY